MGATVPRATTTHDWFMHTNSDVPVKATTVTVSRVTRALTTALLACAFVVLVAFGGPDENSSRWDDNNDAHSEIGYHLAP